MLNKELYFSLMKTRQEDFKNISGASLEIIMDESVILEYERKNNKQIGCVYESPYHFLLVDLVIDTRTEKMFTYERILNFISGGSVIIPFFKGKFVLLKQFRHALRDYQICFPRGFCEVNNTPEQNALKELTEELGVDSSSFKLKYLGDVVADSGLCGNKVSIYLAVLEDEPKVLQTEGITNIITLNEFELKDNITNGKINDGFSLSAFALYQNRQ